MGCLYFTAGTLCFVDTFGGFINHSWLTNVYFTNQTRASQFHLQPIYKVLLNRFSLELIL
jgi:hypothetical protein